MNLKEDVRGLMDSTLYGSKGEEVKVISTIGHVLIVEGMKGVRFPTLIDNVTTEVIMIEVANVVPVTPQRKVKSVKPKLQSGGTLF
jgi:hypothetical protein